MQTTWAVLGHGVHWEGSLCGEGDLEVYRRGCSWVSERVRRGDFYKVQSFHRPPGKCPDHCQDFPIISTTATCLQRSDP